MKYRIEEGPGNGYTLVDHDEDTGDGSKILTAETLPDMILKLRRLTKHADNVRLGKAEIGDEVEL